VEESACRLLGHRAVGPALLKNGVDRDTVQCIAEPPYALPNIFVDYVQQEPPGIPTAFWRGVGPTRNVFAVESFIDELATAAKQDPVAYRRGLLLKNPRAKAVLELAAEQSGWGQALPKGEPGRVRPVRVWKLHGAGSGGGGRQGR